MSALLLEVKARSTGPAPAVLRFWGGAAITVLGAVLLLAEGLRAAAGVGGGAVAGGLVAALATAAGALPALFVRRIAPRVEDAMLGFGAGVMLAASAFSLILPALDAATPIAGSRAGAALFTAVALGLGAAALLGLDRLLPHEHAHAGRVGGAPGISRAWLMVVAIAIHNFPEGMAIGVAFAGEGGAGWPVAGAIALQDVPEGLAVAVALRAASLSPLNAALAAAASGLLEPLGALFGAGAMTVLPALFPLGLAFAAGAMIFVVSHEIVPETHRRGHQTHATLGLVAGFMVMMVLDTALAA
ncbi:MAG: ZIP family metal transporter [Pseudomonadota bacterium]|jgi:ZIP family zinc transporter